MIVITTLAKSQKQRLLAHDLVKKTYLSEFKVDIDNLKTTPPSQQFRSEVLIAQSASTKEILGTISIIYPNDLGKFPCESLFGFDLENDFSYKNNYVEIGRFATSDEGKKDNTVLYSLLLGIKFLLQKRQIQGWVATVKEDLFSFINNIKLPIHQISQLPNISQDNILWGYIGDISSLHLLDTTSIETVKTFSMYDRYITNNKIKIIL